MVLSQKRANTQSSNSIIKAWLSATNSQKHHGKENIQEEQDLDLERAIELSRQEYNKQEQQKANMNDRYNNNICIMNNADDRNYNNDDENDFQTLRPRKFIPIHERRRMSKNKKRKIQVNTSDDSEIPSSNANELVSNINEDGTTEIEAAETVATPQRQQTPVKIKEEKRLEAEEEEEVELDDIFDEEIPQIKQEKKVKQEAEEEEYEIVIEYEDCDDNSSVVKQEGETNKKSAIENTDTYTTTKAAQAGTATTATADTQDDIEIADLTNWTPSSNPPPIFTPSPSPPARLHSSTSCVSLEDPLLSSSPTVTSKIDLPLSSLSSFHTSITTTNTTSPSQDKGKGPARTNIQSNNSPSSIVDTLNIPKRRKRSSNYSSPPVLTQDNYTPTMNHSNNDDNAFDCPNCLERFPLSMVSRHGLDCIYKNEDFSLNHVNSPLPSPSSNRMYHQGSANQNPTISLIGDGEDDQGIHVSRAQRQQRLNQLSFNRNHRRRTPSPIYNEIHSDIEEFSDDDIDNIDNQSNKNNDGYNGMEQNDEVSDYDDEEGQDLQKCPICSKQIPKDVLPEHVNEELNAQESQSSVEPPSTSTMGELRDSFNIVTVSDEIDSESDNNDAIDLSGSISLDHEGFGIYGNEEYEDDGYMSPLEGFVNVNPQEHPEYYNQGERTRASSSRQRQSSTTTRGRPSSSSSRAASRRGRAPRASSSTRGTRRRLTSSQKRAIHAKKNNLSKSKGGSKKSKATSKSKSKSKK
ncbi:hypothetical protein BDA99DRAFT_492307 [Phascolomyces articulosus]|uniref:Uncharacterized protein n=1 Tax=Phascolomyces articulosus TaxID=60185 RepID=A0AAD5KQA7_9FUNG|nr:hypothetical protein BDA99DRAFT_492307 [Phascolomyces articulosus]